jgi:hypothetical protein
MSEEATLHDLHQKVFLLYPWWPAPGDQIADPVQKFLAQSVLPVLVSLLQALLQPVIKKM